MVLLLLIFIGFLPLSAQDKMLAVVPDTIQTIFAEKLPGSKFRIDGSLSFQDRIWIPVIAETSAADESQMEPIKLVFKTDTDVYFFSNKWVFIPIENNTIKGLDYYPEIIQETLLEAKIIPEFLLPQDFSLPRDLAMIAGRLPVPLRAVELASDREVLYRERVAQKQETKIEFFAYSASNGDLALFAIDNGSELLKNDLSELSSDLSFLSKVKNIDAKHFFIEQNQAQIYRLEQSNKLKFDATKPIEKDLNPEFKLEKYFSLYDYGLKASLQDFVISNDKSTLYVLTKNPNNLLVINLETKEQIKKIETPYACSDLFIVSRSTSEPDKILFFSKAAAKVFILNTFDHRISQEIALNKLKQEFNYLPRSLLVDTDNIYLAVEAIAKKKNDLLVNKASLLALDIVTGALQSEIPLDFVPQWMSFSADGRYIYTQGSFLRETYLAKIDLGQMQLSSNLKLDADFRDPSQLELLNKNILLVPSSISNQLGFIDTESWTMMKKFDLGFQANLLHKYVSN